MDREQVSRRDGEAPDGCLRRHCGAHGLPGNLPGRCVILVLFLFAAPLPLRPRLPSLVLVSFILCRLVTSSQFGRFSPVSNLVVVVLAGCSPKQWQTRKISWSSGLFALTGTVAVCCLCSSEFISDPIVRQGWRGRPDDGPGPRSKTPELQHHRRCKAYARRL